MEQAVIVHIRLGDRQTAIPERYKAVHALEGQLEQAIKDKAVGEFDGDEFGEDECVLYMYGPNADHLYRAIEPVLKAARLADGGYAVKRYGAAQDPNAREARVTW